MYRPLPDNVTIKNSKIDGLGMFATKDIKVGENFGITHIANEEYPDGYIRTPLGGFYNHSEDPNCVNVKLPNGDLILISIKPLKAGDEITTTYLLYDPSK